MRPNPTMRAIIFDFVLIVLIIGPAVSSNLRGDFAVNKNFASNEQIIIDKDDVVYLDAEECTSSFDVVVTHVNDPTDPEALQGIGHGDWIGFDLVDFGAEGKRTVEARVQTWKGGWIEARLGSIEGELIGKVLIVPTGNNWENFQADIEHTTGIHDVYFVFTQDLPDSGDGMFKVNWIKFYTSPMETVSNPIIKNVRTADPAAHVFPHDPDTVWLYTSQDPSNAIDYSTMDGYHAFSSKDMKTWTDHGEILHSRNVGWGSSGWMWAPDVCYKNGKYYLYFPHTLDQEGNKWRIGVAISDFPQGPFTDIGHHMEGPVGTDPSCFIDDDGSAYLMYGQLMIAKLDDNMVELAEKPRKINDDFNGVMEGAWMHKRNGIYYYSFTILGNGGEGSMQSFYAMANNPYGPYSNNLYNLNRHPVNSQDHHSIIEFKGEWYYFYHVGGAGTHAGVRRMTSVDKLEYFDDGIIKPIVMTRQGVHIR